MGRGGDISAKQYCSYQQHSAKELHETLQLSLKLYVVDTPNFSQFLDLEKAEK